jgi:hypothetical protein
MQFRKSGFSDNNAAECVEVAQTLDALRDSKNPGDLLVVNLQPFLTAVKADRLSWCTLRSR